MEDASASPDSLALVGDAATARVALSPLRRELLARLRVPGSASSLANALDMPRQKIGYHLRVLEEAGLIGPVGTRKRRGFTERLLEAKSDALLVDPMILGPANPDAVEKQDSFAAGYLVRTAAGIVREVSRMREAAAEEGSRLLTFTLEADIGFAAPKDIERFAGRIAESLAALAREFAPEPGRRIYRLTAAGHPAVGERAKSPGIN
ncbi:MAG: helix-turn-helix domain-containing protein [Sphingosinicella sp.]|uniref:helix-turn-helix domain-containing protein n=1 Tax=Sphingosinicella sp. TaxID=1917971 RepID=UPI004037C98A